MNIAQYMVKYNNYQLFDTNSVIAKSWGNSLYNEQYILTLVNSYFTFNKKWNA